jgi:hypothetical protein
MSARESGCEERRVKHPQCRKDYADENGVSPAIRRNAVERTADVIGPEQREGREQTKEPRHAQVIVVQAL